MIDGFPASRPFLGTHLQTPKHTMCCQGITIAKYDQLEQRSPIRYKPFVDRYPACWALHNLTLMPFVPMKEMKVSQYDPSSTTIFREMREDDTIHVHEIHTDCLTVSLKDHYSTAELDAWMYGRSPEGYWRFANSGEIFRVAERGGQIVGFANWQGDELRSLFISPAHQHAGIGSALFRFCDQESRVAFVKATLSAVPFYTRFSFVEAGHSFDMKRGIQLPYAAMRRKD